MRSTVGRVPVRRFRRHEHLAQGGEVQDRVFRIDEGWACRYALLPDGRRQITGLYLPGDVCEPQWALSGRAALPVVALTEVFASEFPIAGEGHANDEQDLLGPLLTNFNRQSDWIVSLGRRSASGRIVTLFSEIYYRLAQSGRVRTPCTIPLTQQDIADVVGLTPVHVNRVLSNLRRRGLVRFTGKTIIVPSPEELAAVETTIQQV